MTEGTPVRNRGGAPKGNTNALKHGLYAATLHRRTLAQLENAAPVDFARVESFLASFLYRLEGQLDVYLAGISMEGEPVRLLTLGIYTLALPAPFPGHRLRRRQPDR